MEAPIPCKECISFALCNAQIKQLKPADVTQLSMKKNCNALKKYIKLGSTRGDHAIMNKVEIAKARKLFGLPEVIPDQPQLSVRYK